MKTRRLAWLFDVDGTLLLTDGAARAAIAAAVADRLGVEDDLRDIAFTGRLDPLILADILRKHGRALDDGEAAAFWSHAFAHMRALLRPGRGRLMPGVLGLLDTIEAEPTWVKGLLTGNMTGMAAIKLEHYGIADRCAFGAFCEQAADRNALAIRAVGRVQETYGVPASRCIVIGDTEHDIACARAAGAKVIAVATGMTPFDTLAALAPDLVLENLADPKPVLEWARTVEVA